MNENVRKLVQKGKKVFPCNNLKKPITSNGFYNASNDIDKLDRMFYKEDLLIGLPTGNINNIVVIDIDVNKKIPGTDREDGTYDIDTRSVDEIVEELEKILGVPFDTDTLQVETPSGGRHYYFKTDFTKLNSATCFFDKMLPVDIRANGGYVIFADDKSYNFYDIFEDDIIENLDKYCKNLQPEIEAYKKQQVEAQQFEDEILPPEEIVEIRSALSFMSSDDRDLWIRIGMILKSTGSPSAYGLWNEWSKSSSKYKPEDMEKRWQGLKPKDVEIGSLFFEAKKLGWTTTYQKTEENQQVNPDKINYTVKKQKKPEFPKHLLEPPGVVGELMKYMVKSSIKPQPIYALGASIAAIASLQGRKIQTDSGIRTNIYCLGVGLSGSGKDSPRQVIKNIFREIGASKLTQTQKLASDAAIETALSLPGAESSIFLLDEIGRFIQTTKSLGSPHLRQVVDVILTLYSSAGDVYEGKSYADESRQKIINHPNLCIYGTTVPNSLYKGMTLDYIENGFLSRMLIFESTQKPSKKKKRDRKKIKPPIDLLNKMKRIYDKPTNIAPVGNIDHMTVVNPQIVDFTEDAIDMIDNYDKYIEDKQNKYPDEIQTIFSRTTELAEKIALIIAGGVNIENPVITEKEINYGIELTNYLSEYMMYIVENFMADNQYEHDLKNMLNIIRKNGKIQRSKLTQKTQNIQGYVRNDILNALKDSNQIAEITEGEGNKKTSFFIAI